jgi:hypothetical protein
MEPNANAVAKIDLMPKSISKHLPTMVKDELFKLSAGKQDQFIEEYTRKAKSLGAAYLLGLFGWHYAYMRKWGLFWLWWALWIVTFGIVGFIWWVVDLFRMPGIVGDYNRDVAINVLRDMKALST